MGTTEVSNNSSAAREFWNWFQVNHTQFLFLTEVDEAEKQRLLDDFLTQLHHYCPHLFFAIGGDPAGKPELIISAEGNRDYFKDVEDLMSIAPTLKDWTLIAFKPAQGFDFKLQYGDILFDPSDLWFLPMVSKSNQKFFGLRIGFNHFDESRRKAFLNGSYLMIDNALGERQAGLDVHHIDVCRLPEDPAEKGFIELRELKEYLDWWRMQG